jgi:hypothetical protein
VELSGLADGWTSEDPDVRTSLVGEVGYDVAAGVSGQQARRPEVVICQRPQGGEERSMSRDARIDVGIGLHLETLSAGRVFAAWAAQICLIESASDVEAG